MAGFIYLLCAATASMCAVLLWRGYRNNRVRLLFWSGACFWGLAIENLLLCADWFTPPEISFATYRQVAGLAALLTLLYGLIWESD